MGLIAWLDELSASISWFTFEVAFLLELVEQNFLKNEKKSFVPVAII